MKTAIQQEIETSQIVQENQQVIHRAGDRWTRHDERLTGVSITNIISRPHRGIFGRCLIAGEVRCVIFVSHGLWRVNGD